MGLQDASTEDIKRLVEHKRAMNLGSEDEEAELTRRGTQEARTRMGKMAQEAVGAKVISIRRSNSMEDGTDNISIPVSNWKSEVEGSFTPPLMAGEYRCFFTGRNYNDSQGILYYNFLTSDSKCEGAEGVGSVAIVVDSAKAGRERTLWVLRDLCRSLGVNYWEEQGEFKHDPIPTDTPYVGRWELVTSRRTGTTVNTLQAVRRTDLVEGVACEF